MTTPSFAREAAELITATYDSADQFAAVAQDGCGEWEIDRASEIAEQSGVAMADIIAAIEAVCREKTNH